MGGETKRIGKEREILPVEGNPNRDIWKLCAWKMCEVSGGGGITFPVFNGVFRFYPQFYNFHEWFP